MGESPTRRQSASCGLGWAVARLRKRIAAFDDKAVRELLDSHRMSPVLFKFSDLSHRGQVLMGSSSKFDVYEVDFGWGRAVAVRSGIDNKFEGKVMAFPAREGGGGVELEICLSSVAMAALLADTEFMEAANFENLVTPFSCPYCPPN